MYRRFHFSGFYLASMLLLCSCLPGGRLWSQRSVRDSLVKKWVIREKPGYDSLRPHYLVEWKGMPPTSMVIRSLQPSMAVIEVHSEEELLSLSAGFSVLPINTSWKLSPQLDRTLNGYPALAQKVFILTGRDWRSLKRMLESSEGDIEILQTDTASQSLVVRAKAGWVARELINRKEVYFIDERAEPHTEIGVIGYDRTQHGMNSLERIYPSANGTGVVAGIKEQRPDADDIDLLNRSLPSTLSAANVQQHATTMATIIGGAGNSYYDGRGLASHASFFSSSFNNLFADDATVLLQKQVSFQNHSYGTVVQSFYGAEANSYDQQAWSNPFLLHVFSAGNQGNQSASEGVYKNIAGYANLTGNFKSAKNVITVGALDNSGSVAPLSSAGPIYDGRLAPQLCAHGPNGTSDAAAMVSGTIAVLQQLYKDSNGQQLPASSLIKAILFNTADDIHSTGIDYKTGYGLLNSLAACRSLQQRQYDRNTINPGGTWTRVIAVPVNAAQLKVTLCWNDTAASVNNARALINDLDLEIRNLSTLETYQPWVLSSFPHPDSLKTTPVRRRDSLNTSEQISIDLPSPGNYEIRVSARSSNPNAIPFCVAFRADTAGAFEFTSPKTAEDIDPDEMREAFVRWNTSATDLSQTGTLSVSFSQGQQWQTLAQLPLALRQYKWTIRDTSCTVLFKMQTASGTYLSDEVLLSPVTHPRVDFVCSDSFQLSWNRYPYANAYQVYAMKGGAYLEETALVTDTFMVVKRHGSPYITYAVEPRTSNGLKAIRSRALNIEIQGTFCFYKALNYELLTARSARLILEAGGSSYIDSIGFEKLNGSGQVIASGSVVKASAIQSVYTYVWDGLSNGAHLFRARIRLKSGGTVYSNVITVLTSGDRYIYFYPNPASGHPLVNYITRPGLPGDSKLLLFDITGRLLRQYNGLPGKIDLSLMPRGILIYQLIDINNKKLESGKIIW